MNASQEKLDALFPVPTAAPRVSALAPSRLAGPNPRTADVLIEVLQENHKSLHIYFNDRGFHNHSTHHMLAIYALGAGPNVIQGAFGTHVAYQRPAVPAPGPINKDNWKEHLGDERYYQSYLAFFSDLLLADGPAAVFEQYVISKYANFVPANGKTDHPNMYNKFLGGIVHPLIHTGYGAEFGQLGMWAEGLAEASVESAQSNKIVPAALYEEMYSGPDLLSRVASLAVSPNKNGVAKSTHALSILARVAKDPSFAFSAIGLNAEMGPVPIDQVTEKCIEKLHKYLEEWTVEPTQEDFDKKLEELMWMNTIIYSAAGFGDRHHAADKKREFKADFYLMHLVTSVLFLPSLASYLPPAATVFLLRSYFITSLVAYVSRGRPALPLAAFYAKVTDAPAAPGPHPTPSTDVCNGPVLKPESKQKWLAAGVNKVVTPNPWLAIIQTTLVHPDEHLCKLQRALWHFGSVFGSTRQGTFSFLSGELDGADVLDGSLFIRAAGLTANRLGWVREGEVQKLWDFGDFLH